MALYSQLGPIDEKFLLKISASRVGTAVISNSYFVHSFAAAPTCSVVCVLCTHILFVALKHFWVSAVETASIVLGEFTRRHDKRRQCGVEESTCAKDRDCNHARQVAKTSNEKPD